MAETLRGTSGNDSLTNSSVDVIVYGFEGNNTVNGTISGGGHDTITSSGNENSIRGGNGNDSINSTGQDATIYGNDGADILTSKGSNSYIDGGDYITVKGGAGNDKLTLNDKPIYGSARYNPSAVIEYINGDSDDTITGFSGNDTLNIVGSYTCSTIDNDVIFKVGSGSITLKDAASLSTVNVLGTLATDTGNVSIPADALKYNGLTWEEAKAYCEARGGYLVVITDANEQTAVQNLLTKKAQRITTGWAALKKTALGIG